MSDPQATRTFQCKHCEAGIQIPANLPPTTAPCPKCGQQVTSPDWNAPADEAVAPPEKKVSPTVEKTVAAPAVAEAHPKSEQPNNAPTGSEAKEAAEPTEGKGKMIVAVATLGAALLLGAAAVKVLFFSNKDKSVKEAPTAAQSLSPEERKENAYRTRGWIDEAQGVMQNFLDAKTNEERALWTIRGASNESEMAAVYEKFDEDAYRTPVNIFSPVPLGNTDTQRGLFLMTYNRPEQFTIRSFFRPVPPLRVRYGLEKPDPWLISEASVTNFVDGPMKVMAFFLKTPEGLRLDWQTYAQTKFRLLNQFVSNPEPGARGVFRVFVQQDVDLNGRDTNGFTVYRFSDPANLNDFAKVLIKDDSDLGKALAPLKWRDRIVPKAPVRNATVSLVWSDEPEPSLQMGELICWEFLELGGVRGNWKSKASEPVSVKASEQ